MLAIVAFLLNKEFVGTRTHNFARERVMKMFFLRNREVVNTLFGGFLKSTGNTIDAVTDSTMSHSFNVY